jgi:hypothetical protein
MANLAAAGIDAAKVDTIATRWRNSRCPRQSRAIAGAGVDGNQPRAGIDDHWVERDRERLGGLKGLAQDLLHVRDRRARHDGSIQLAVPYSVVDDRDLVVAKLVAIEARRLVAGNRRRC